MALPNRRKSAFKVVSSVAIVLGTALLLVAVRGNSETATATPGVRAATTLAPQVALDNELRYQQAKSGGTPMDACVQAGIVAEAYRQANDQANFSKWKQTENSDCSAT